MKRLFAVAAFLAASELAGCASTPFDYKTGSKITNEQLAQFTPGKTIQGDVVTAFGQPNKKQALGEKELWYYDYTKIGALGGNVSESTVFEFDKAGKLLSGYKTGSTGRTGNPLLDAAKKP
jgi:outer membrane protein assembly factor BamE (lipoprotein component of BamABCDE complex)